MSSQTQESRRVSNAKYKAKRIQELGGLEAYRDEQARKRREWYAKKREARMQDPLIKTAAAIVQDVAREQVEEYVDAARRLEKTAEEAPKLVRLAVDAQRVTQARRDVSFVTGGTPSDNCKANVKILIAWEQALVDAGIAVVGKKTPIHKHAYLTSLFSTLSKAHLSIFGEEWNCDTFEWLKDWPRVYEALKQAYTNRQTLSTQIGKVVGLLRWLKYQGPEWIPIFTEASATMGGHSKEVQSGRATNKAGADEKANSLPWEEMVALLDGITDVHDKFLYGFQVLFAPRRLDIQYLTLTTEPNATEESLKTDTTFSDELNYYVKVNAKKAFLVFRKYKTRADYGVQVFPVPVKLMPLANAYIKTFKLGEGDRFFQPGIKFSDYMRQMYQRVTGKPHMLQNYVRHSFSTWLSREFQGKSVAARKEFTDRMGHSLSESELYKRVNSDDESIEEPPKKRRGRPRARRSN